MVGVRTAVPYSMSSSVCLLFFRCCDSSHRGVSQRDQRGSACSAPWRPAYPCLFLLLLLDPLQLPLLLHVLKKLLAVHQELSILLGFPRINLGF